ncbi:MAG: SH3 domain-containing protein [Saprospiraceae bacterium]|nr:SH3 domain-containing protein [Saprospiraceae bacterium]
MKLPRTESLIILAFLGCVALWAVSKCSARRSEIVRQVRDITDDDSDDRPVRHDTVKVPVTVNTTSPAPTVAAPPPDQPPSTLMPAPGKTPRPSVTAPVEVSTKAPSKTPPPATTTPTVKAKSDAVSTLYATIDGLKVRKGPGLKNEVVATLELYEPVEFLGKKSEKTEEISLGYEKVTDHWVKVRTKSGKEGWVFGAGVHYYKMKRKGVME